MCRITLILSTALAHITVIISSLELRKSDSLHITQLIKEPCCTLLWPSVKASVFHSCLHLALAEQVFTDV